MNSYELVLESIQAVLTDIVERVEIEPEKYLKKIRHNGKDALVIDVDAEERFKALIEQQIPNIIIYGEESSDKRLNLSNVDTICALVDMVDGTDLLERGLSNWCSSAVFFRPQNPVGEKIIAAFIGTPSKEIYFATSETENVWVIDSNFKLRQVSGSSKVTELAKSSICFYGQKGSRLFDVVNTKLFKLLDEDSKLKEPLYGKTRIYNLAGMPMMVKLIDKQVKNASGIDVIFDKKGQKPHDFVPGAFLIKKAGATVINRDTNCEMEYSDIEEKLLKPFAESSDTRYVVASTPDLANEIHKLLN
jgi:fructose-1,6-bisphosphatase/inositol monophosphatase family enzyme